MTQAATPATQAKPEYDEFKIAVGYDLEGCQQADILDGDGGTQFDIKWDLTRVTLLTVRVPIRPEIPTVTVPSDEASLPILVEEAA
ncbi:hypothetical protein [Rhodomicrobium lacus]|uniref:hypothetical protein n=1 Tax=Rhodomicrobium lacus TaxID=2498452 RepID=UPI000F8C7D27|nr:hypothetical protein [Rhodomicrobium lacus]